MLIKNFLGMKVLDNNAKEIGKIADADFNVENGTIEKFFISLNKGIFSNEQVEISFDDIRTIGDYVVLDCDLPIANEVEE